MSRLWGKLYKKQKLIQNHALECGRDDAYQGLTELCRVFDIPMPIWLAKHDKEFNDFGRTSFLKDHFIESISFDKFELEWLEDANVTRKNRDPRNDFSS